MENQLAGDLARNLDQLKILTRHWYELISINFVIVLSRYSLFLEFYD
jgi:hypothetical protein